MWNTHSGLGTTSQALYTAGGCLINAEYIQWSGTTIQVLYTASGCLINAEYIQWPGTTTHVLCIASGRPMRHVAIKCFNIV